MTPDENTPLYQRRDIEALGEHYMRHLDAMTSEGLHSKSDIAAELAWRDSELAAKEEALNQPPDWERVKLLYKADPEMVFDEDYGWLHVAIQGEIRALEKQAAASEGLRAALTRSLTFLEGSDPCVTSGGVKNIELRREIKAALSSTPSPWRGIAEHLEPTKEELVALGALPGFYGREKHRPGIMRDMVLRAMRGTPQPPADGREGA